MEKKWVPILNSEHIKSCLNSISECLYQSIKDKDYSLYVGQTGVALFFYYYWKFAKQDRFLDKANSLILENIGWMASNTKPRYSLCNGDAGIMWAIDHLIDNRFIDGDSSELFQEKDSVLFLLMEKDIKEGKYDFLHNALGVGFYFLGKKNMQEQNYIESLIFDLEKIAEIDPKGCYKWKSLRMLENETEEVYNTSMSHGIASIIVFLCKTYKKNIQKDITEKLLTGAVNFLISLKSDVPETALNSFFPSSISIDKKNKPSPSRLSWCYGDLSIGISLWHASQVLKSKEWERIAINVLIQTTLRIDNKKEAINDAGFCHGSSGIAHIYNRIYQYTGIITFRDSAIFWINDTLKKAVFKDGLAGFKVYRHEKFGGWINEEGLLEGIAGIGLVLLASISSIEPKWDECFLLS